MLNQKIKQLRQANGWTQQELADQLHVVRQTVSKWERGQSIPDAKQALQLAQLFQIPVSELLDSEQPASADLQRELERQKALLDQYKQERQRQQKISKKRGQLLFLSFATLLIALWSNQPVLTICLTGLCWLAALVILLRNLNLLSGNLTDIQTRALRVSTCFDGALLLICMVAALLEALGVRLFPGESEKFFAVAVVSIVMIFSGLISRKLPFQRHTGLRLPWTVRDEDTWNVAHNALAITALPTALGYIAAALCTDQMELVTGLAMLIWIGIPAAISGLYFYRKFHV